MKLDQSKAPVLEALERMKTQRLVLLMCQGIRGEKATRILLHS